MNYDVLMGFLALILLILWYVYGLRQYLKLKDKNKRLFFAVMLNAKILMP